MGDNNSPKLTLCNAVSLHQCTTKEWSSKTKFFYQHFYIDFSRGLLPNILTVLTTTTNTSILFRSYFALIPCYLLFVKIYAIFYLFELYIVSRNQYAIFYLFELFIVSSQQSNTA